MLALVNIAKIIVSFLVITWLSLSAFWSEPKVPEAPPVTMQEKNIVPLPEAGAPNEPAPTKNIGTDQSDAQTNDTKHTGEQIQTEIEKTPSELEAPTPTISESLFTDINATARKSIVNIFCEMHNDRSIKTITGSGVVIDPRGVVLTNAHIAQFFLVKDYPSKGATKCTLRVGNPATPRYNAEILYMPITWVYQHADEITAEAPVGTGEGDYAFLRITNSANGEPLPSAFPYLPVNDTENIVATGDDVLVASYPALVAESTSIKNDLYLVSTPTQVNTLFTFSSNVLDLFALNGNIASYHGSSGGAVVNTKGELVGLIVTSTNDNFVLERKLRALTLAYISKNLKRENGTTLFELLEGNLSLRTNAFRATTAPILTKLLTDALKN